MASTTLDSRSTRPVSTGFWPTTVRFLERRRIILSSILFCFIIGQDLLRGIKPHDITNLSDRWSVLGLSLVALGLAVRSWAAGTLKKNEELATNGPYRLIRNPLYVGSYLMMIGFCTLIGDWSNFAIILGPLLAVYWITVRKEERVLKGLFPAQWAIYSKTTPRFVPRLRGPRLEGTWRFSQWIHAREFEAFGGALLALVGLKAWQLVL